MTTLFESTYLAHIFTKMLLHDVGNLLDDVGSATLDCCQEARVPFPVVRSNHFLHLQERGFSLAVSLKCGGL